jgi:hypothetical protein
MPGLDDEVRMVNVIYNWFIDDSLNEYEIDARHGRTPRFRHKDPEQ